MADYEAILTNEPFTASGTLEWDSIPQTYDHLVIRGFLKKGGAASYNSGDTGARLAFNDDHTQNWDESYQGPNTTSGYRNLNTYGYIRGITGDTQRYPMWAMIEIIIGGYALTINPKSVIYRTWGAYKSSGTIMGQSMVTGCLTQDADGGTLGAISKIALIGMSATGGIEEQYFCAGSVLTLYGLKAA